MSSGDSMWTPATGSDAQAKGGRLTDAFEGRNRVGRPPLPSLRSIEDAAQRVHERWPDVDAIDNPDEREQLARKLSGYIEDWPRNWPEDVRLSFVLSAASAVFDHERRGRSEFDSARNFLCAEIALQDSGTFLSGMLRIYLESFRPGASHSNALSEVLRKARKRMSGSAEILVSSLPAIFDVDKGPDLVGAKMLKMDDPFQDLRKLGFRNPHGEGFMDYVHIAFSEGVQDRLNEQDEIDRYLVWLRPSGGNVWERGAARGVEALTHPWLGKTPDDSIRSHLVETLIDMYGDPRIRRGGAWSGVGERYMRVIHRWLTREDMRFFIGVVDDAQHSHMWTDRRDFWLELYDEGLIDAAWAAFSTTAMQVARNSVHTGETRLGVDRFGWQQSRSNTSLLIMKIADKVFVEGCHSYETRVFDEDDDMAPELYQEGYDCEEIRIRATRSMRHRYISRWSEWVRDMINADVPLSDVEVPYPKVHRPFFF